MLKKLLFFSALLLCAAGTMHAQTCELTNLYVSRTGWVSWHSSCQDAEVRVVLSTLDGTTLADSLTTDTTMQLPTTALVDKTLYHLSVTQTLSPGQTVDCEWFYSSCSHLAMVTNAVAAPRPTGGVALRWDYPAITASAAEAPYAITMFDGYVTDPGAMSDGSDASWLKNYQSSFGPSVNKTTNSWVGFPVVLERPTTLSEIEVYAYQTGSTTTSTFTALYVRIYNGNPIENGTVIWGDADANIMTATAFTGCYRGSDGATTGMTRPIMSITASGLDIQLEPGTYWVTYALTGTESSGPWAVPHAVPGIGNTGNGVQFSSPKWIPLKDSYSESEIYYSPAFRIAGSMVPSAVGDTIGVAVFRNGRWLADVHGNSFVDPTGTVADHYSLRLLYGGDRLNRVGNAYYAMGCPNEVSFYHVDAMAAAYNPDEDDIHSPYMTVNWSDPIFFEDFESGDFSQYSWQLDATYPWSISTNSPHGGAYCMKSGCSGVDNANSDMTLEVDIDKDGEISFFAKISSESSWDKGHFYIDSVEKKEFSGECDWTEYRFPITAGHHTLRWRYSKDADEFSGDDCLYIDDVKLTYTNQSKEIGWHSYCSYFNTAYKSTVSSTPKWGYEYAPEDLLGYKGWWMTKVSLFSDKWNYVGGNHTCRVYVGGSNPEEGTLVTSLTVDVPQGQNAWLDWDLPTAVEVTGDDTIWVIWQVNTATSDYPAGGGNYSTKNSTNSGGWWDDGNGWKHLDIAWAMRQWFIPSTTPGAYSEQINKEELLTTPRKRDLEVQYELYRTDGITNTLLVTGLPDTTMSFVDSLWVGLPEGFYRFGVKVVGDTSILWSNILFHPAPIEHTVTALASSTAGGSVSGSGTFYYGTTATLTATPATCYHFTGWSNGLTSDTINITVKSDSTLTANFERNAPLTGDTTAVACDQFTWYDTPFTSSTTTTHDLFTAEGCDSTVTLHLTVNYSTTGDTTAVVCDSFNWYDHTNLTSSTNTLTHLFTNAAGCDSTVTLDLTVNYSTIGDTTAVVCDNFNWYDHTNLTSSTNTLTHLFPAGNQWNCDSTVTLHLTVNYSTTGDTTAVVCDSFNWYDHTNLTSSTNTLTHLFPAGNQWNCDSTVTLDLTVHYSTTGDTTAVECDSFNWYDHTNLTSSTNTLTHLFTNAAGCDSTVTLDLTVNYSTIGDTTAVVCDSFNWYDHTNLTSSTNTLTHLFTNAAGCDSTVTLDLTVNYSTIGDTTAVVCDNFNWYDHTNLTSSTNTLTHLFPAGNQWNCDSTLTLHLTVHYSTTGDTAAVVYEPFTWYEHTALDSTQNVNHTFLGGNAMGCDSTVTLHLRYALFPTLWEGDSVVIYNSQSQTGLTASYVDDSNHTQTVTLTFTNQGSGATLAGYPVNAGRYTVTARPVLPVDSLADATRLMVVEPATLNVLGAEVVVAKLVDGNADAEVSNQGTLQNIQGNDNISHVTTATFDNANAGYDKVITLHYALTGTTQMLNNYTLGTTSEPYAELGAILEPMVPDTTGTGNDSTVADHGFDVYAYGYCTGSSYSLRYHLRSGNPDQYKIDFADIRFTDVDWTNLSVTGAEGTIDIDVPVDLPTGDYTMTVTFRDSRFPWIESSPITASFHVNLPETFTKPIFDNVITIIDTCHCFSDIQWYHRANASDTWQAIPGATGYYYQEAGSLTGEYFVRAKMNGVETYTCPQTDMNTLVTETRQKVAINVWPNPTSESVNVNISNENPTHILRILNTVGLEMEHRTFDGESTRVDMSDYPRGSYMLSIDGIVVRVIRN